MSKHVVIDIQRADEIQIVQLSGFMDMSEVPKLEQALQVLIKEGHPRIVLDLSRLEYISSAGLGAIIGSIREVRRLGGDIKIGGYSPPLFEILRTFGFTSVFDTLASREEAIKKFKR